MNVIVVYDMTDSQYTYRCIVEYTMGYGPTLWAAMRSLLLELGHVRGIDYRNCIS